jgi:predicted SprT family Zn-dependent metalloprotease
MTASIRWPETRGPTPLQALPISGDLRGGRLTTEPLLPEHLDNPPCPPPAGLETCPFTDRLAAFTRWPATCAMPETPVPNPLLKPSLNPTRVLTRWAKLWRTPGLVDRVTVEFSPRLTHSLGRVRPATGVIRLNARLKNTPREFLLEVLCHEAAHVATYMTHGSRAQPHGPEWRDLVRRAGYEPTTQLAHPSLPPPRTNPSSNVSALVPHPGTRHRYRCPICQHDYFVRRKSSRLHCTVCHPAGRPEPLHYQPLPGLV